LQGQLSRPATAASSGFFSASGGDDDDLDDAESAVISDLVISDATSAAAKAQQQQQQHVVNEVSRECFEDAESEFTTPNSSFSGASTTCFQQQQQQQSGDDVDTNTAAAEGVVATPIDADVGAVDDAELALPVGVAGVMPGQFLQHFPDRPLRVPILQDEPVFTEDQIIERQTALMQLATASAAASPASGTGGDADADAAAAAAAATDYLLLRQRLMAAPLLSDMSAFKAANPGCCLDDFLRWYTPRDWQQQQQGEAQPSSQQQDAELCDEPPAAGTGSVSNKSNSVINTNNSWQQLWGVAPAQPAAAQRPLLNPHKEGEQVLHYLETISPGGLFGQLLAAAVAEALALLAGSRGAQLPAAAAAVDR
jgi:Rab3 GTPase-activating protein catalytic subunit